MKQDGIVVILAYPETFVSQTQFWYRPIFELVGLGKNGKIRAGHAAALIINKNNGQVEYTDFGRYITPHGLGRVRTKETDPELDFQLKATFDELGKLNNFEELLTSIYQHPSKTHGEGPLYASYVDHLDFAKCQEFISLCQANKEGQNYGPFDLKGSNCSRFVRDIVFHAKHEKVSVFNRIKRLTPSPLGNVYYMGDPNQCYSINGSVKKIERVSKMEPVLKLFGSQTNHGYTTTSKIGIQSKFPNAQWLEGVGAGAWFEIENYNDQYSIKRIDQDGTVVFDLLFETTYTFDLNRDYQFKYGTNAKHAILEQDGRVVEFWPKNKTY